MASNSAINPSVDILDGISLHDLQETLTDRYSKKVAINYSALKDVLASLRRSKGWQPANTSIVHLSADPDSGGQQRFQSMLGHSGFSCEAVGYRETYVSLPPGRTPAEVNSKPVASFAARLAYIAGMMVKYVNVSTPQVLFVTHAFELCDPLTHLNLHFSKPTFGLAYFSSLLDHRWKAVGLLDGKLGIPFFDLDVHSRALIGIDLSSAATLSTDRSQAFTRY